MKTVTLGTLMGTTRSMDALVMARLPINLSFRISRILKEARPIVKEGFDKQNELLKAKETDKDEEAFIIARDLLYAEEIVITSPKITIEELSNAPGLVLAPTDLLALEWLITDETETETTKD